MRKFFILLILVVLFMPVGFGQTAEVDELQQQITANREKLDELQKRIGDYKNLIATKQAEANTLKRQLLVLDDKVAEYQLDIEANELQLATVGLEIDAISQDISDKDASIAKAKDKVAEIIRQLYITDQRSLIEILVLNRSLSVFFDQVNYLSELQGTLQSNINQLQTLKAGLEVKQQDLSNKKIELLDIQAELETNQSLVLATRDTKSALVTQTRQSESRYQDLLAQSVAEQTQADTDIKRLENDLRQKLAQRKNQPIDQFGDATLIWPVSPTRGITTYFYDPSYPFRRYFEHPGIDIRAGQGSPIKAAASGVVGRARDAGMGYSYILLIHADGFSTVYGHVSRIDVSDGDFVTKGQIIGAVGGTPGTRGAGSLTTGPHLHLEVRLNGLPVDPLLYLP